jgi:cysteine synthase B
MNPSGSVKDRAALGIVTAALEEGSLSSQRGLIDASSGNTGVAYAMLGARLGFAVTLCIPANASGERVRRLKEFGAQVILTDPLDGTDGAQREARSRANGDPRRYFYADQYNNPANPAAHYRSTGPEIWSQTEGRVTHLFAGVGTGGTISGTSRYLKEQRPHLRTVGVEPDGPIHGIEGLKHLPTALRPSTYEERWVDETVRVSTEEAERVRLELARREGLNVGRSAGAAVAAALAVGARAPSAVIVAILPDSAREPEERSGG